MMGEPLDFLLAQRADLERRGPPGYGQRMMALEALGELLDRHCAELGAAIARDFGGRSQREMALYYFDWGQRGGISVRWSGGGWTRGWRWRARSWGWPVHDNFLFLRGWRSIPAEPFVWETSWTRIWGVGTPIFIFVMPRSFPSPGVCPRL